MKLSVIALLCATQLAVADLPANPTCNRDNCLRAIVASAFPTRSGSADCASYLATTVESYPTVTTIIPTNIPTYASACSGAVRYSSACACIDVAPSTTVIAPPNGCNDPGVCGTYNIIDSSSCGPVGDCVCVTDANGNSVCVEDEYCNTAIPCASNADCGAGDVCWTSNCCGFDICATPSTICLNPAKKLAFRKAATENVAKRDGCAGSGKCT